MTFLRVGNCKFRFGRSLQSDVELVEKRLIEVFTPIRAICLDKHEIADLASELRDSVHERGVVVLGEAN